MSPARLALAGRSRRPPTPGWSPNGVRIGLSRSASSRSTRPKIFRTVSARRSAVCASISFVTRSIAGPSATSIARTASRNTRKGLAVAQHRAASGRLLQRLEHDLARDLIGHPRALGELVELSEVIDDRRPGTSDDSDPTSLPIGRCDVEVELDTPPERDVRGKVEAHTFGALRSHDLARPAFDHLDHVVAACERGRTSGAQVVDNFALGQQTQHVGVEIGEVHGGAGLARGRGDAPVRDAQLPNRVRAEGPTSRPIHRLATRCRNGHRAVGTRASRSPSRRACARRPPWTTRTGCARPRGDGRGSCPARRRRRRSRDTDLGAAR